MSFNYRRAARLVHNAVRAFDLDLSGLTVYTEAATGAFGSTAATAIAAGADEVYAYAVDSSYGSADRARTHTSTWAATVGDADSIVFPSEKRREHIEEVDILTNTGFVRPIDDEMAGWLGPNASVPLMFEPWEFRDADMNIEALWNAGVPVLGTDETDHRVATQEYIRSLAVKVALDCDLEVYRGTFAVLGGGRMARHAAEGLEALGCTVSRLDPAEMAPETQITSHLSGKTLDKLDALIVVDNRTECLLVGDGGIIDPAVLAERTVGVTVVHICGPVSAVDMDAAGVRYVPDEPADRGTMSFTTGYLGPRPTIDLHAAGLKIGTALSREQHRGQDFQTATERVAANPLASDFDKDFKCEHGFFNEKR